MMLSRRRRSPRSPPLRKEGLKGGGYYVEYRTDDARLTIEVMKKAAECGALAVNYAKVESFLYDESGRMTGAVIQDQISGSTYQITAAKIVNANGAMGG